MRIITRWILKPVNFCMCMIYGFLGSPSSSLAVLAFILGNSATAAAECAAATAAALFAHEDGGGKGCLLPLAPLRRVLGGLRKKCVGVRDEGAGGRKVYSCGVDVRMCESMAVREQAQELQ